MKYRISAIAAIASSAAVIFTACTDSSIPPTVTEAQSAAAVSSATVSASEKAETTANTTETSAVYITETETAASEIITETDRTEMLASEITSSEMLSETEETTAAETVQITETSPPLTEKAPLETPAEVTVPDIYTGNFDGKNMLENELAKVDCSDTANGVILVEYLGQCEKVKVRITSGSSIYDYDLDPGGSVFPLQSGSGAYNIKVLENVSGKTYAIALDMDFEARLSDSFRPFLMPAQYINYDSSCDCVYKAAQLCAGKSTDCEKAAAIFTYVTDNITYDKQLAAGVKSGYVPDPDKTLEKGSGICFDYASLFAAMCRSQNIPTKLVMGYVRGDVYHAWNEVYLEDIGWVTADLFLDSKGWNLLDPTFYAGAADKEEVSEYIGEGSDYSAVYIY